MNTMILEKINKERKGLISALDSFKQCKKENLCYGEYDSVVFITGEMIELSERDIVKNSSDSELSLKCDVLRAQANLLKGFCNV